MRHAHFIAIGGTGMGSLAGLLKARGIRVTGSDREIYPPMSEALERWDIPVSLGFRAERIEEDPPDLIVIGNAVRPDNPEAQAALRSGIPVRSFPDALYEYAMADKHSVVVAGTHGKTTTTSMLATLLLETGRDPGVLVGGISRNLEGSFREGDGAHFLVEGDEYDTVFFDKTPKFLHYHARTAIVTSVEFDHADIYADLGAVKAAFRALIEGMPADGTVIAATGAANVGEVVAGARCRVISYGVGEDSRADVVAADLASEGGGTRFAIRGLGEGTVSALLPALGRHNVSNALAALVAADVLGVPPAESVPALARYRGVKRRQEVRGEVAGVLVVDDFAHHPTAVSETLRALRTGYPERRIVAVFEPRSNTSRRDVFQHAYAEAFDAADRVIVMEVPDAPIYSATGEVTERLSADRLARDLEKRGIDASFEDGVDAIVDTLVGEAAPGDLIVTLSNGSFGGIWEAILSRLAAQPA